MQQRLGEPGAVAEAAEEGPLADARGGGDLIHRDGLDAMLAEQPRGGAEHLLAVALGVGADARRGVEDRKLDQQRLSIHGVRHTPQSMAATGAPQAAACCGAGVAAPAASGAPTSCPPAHPRAAVGRRGLRRNTPPSKPAAISMPAPISAARWNVSTPASCTTRVTAARSAASSPSVSAGLSARSRAASTRAIAAALSGAPATASSSVAP